MISNEKLRTLINRAMDRYAWMNNPSSLSLHDNDSYPLALGNELWSLSEEELADAKAIMQCGSNFAGDLFPNFEEYRELPQTASERHIAIEYMLAKERLPFYLQAGCVNLNIPVLVWRALLNKDIDERIINPARTYVYETARKKIEYAVDMSVCIKIAALRAGRKSLVSEDKERYLEYLGGYNDDEIFSLMQIARRGAFSYDEAFPETQTAEEAREALAEEVNHMDHYVIEGCIVNNIEICIDSKYSEILNKELGLVAAPV